MYSFDDLVLVYDLKLIVPLFEMVDVQIDLKTRHTL
jgi:hypothetical protein